jgi:UDP-glucose 4-epimerase
LTDNQAAKNILKWKPSFSLIDMIRSDIAFRKKYHLDN